MLNKSCEITEKVGAKAFRQKGTCSMQEMQSQPISLASQKRSNLQIVPAQEHRVQVQTDFIKFNESHRNIESLGMLFRRTQFNLSRKHFEQPQKTIPKAPLVRRAEVHSHPATIQNSLKLQRELRKRNRDQFINCIDWISVRGRKQVDLRSEGDFLNVQQVS